MDIKDILELKINNDYFDKDLTIKGYLKSLLLKVWQEGESFSGKHPFGNSGWEYDLYQPLLKFGVISGEIDEYGDIDDFDQKEADTMITSLIDYCFNT